MPKTVDHEEKRREIVEAVCRITLDKGLGAVTFRSLAAELDTSVRSIQYYFGTKKQIRVATLEHVAERSTNRLMAWIDATDGSPKAVLRAFLASFMPNDEESRVAGLMYAAIHTEALFDQSLASDEALTTWRSMHDTIVDILTKVGPSGLTEGIDVEVEARTLTLLLPTLGQSVVDGMGTLDEAYEVIDYTMNRIFAPPI